MKKIAILAPNENKLNELKILFAESLSEIIFEVGSLADGIIKAKQLVEQGVEIIIARGESAYTIRDACPSVAVIDIPISGFDLAIALEKAREYGGTWLLSRFPR